MKISSVMLVPASASNDECVIRFCHQCKDLGWHVPQKVMVLSASGARSMRLWACETHPLPEFVTDTDEA